MGRTIWTVVLLVAVTQAQVIDITNDGRTPPPVETIGTPRLSGSPAFQYDKLRQGTREFGEIILLSSQAFAIGSAGAKDSRILPTRLEFEPAEGFEFSPVFYPAKQDKRFSFHPKPFQVFAETHGGSVRFRFKVRAAPDLAPGDYALQARLSFQFISDTGISEPQRLDVAIPIKVVESKAKVRNLDRSIAGIRGITPAEWAKAVLLAPVTIPLAIFMALIGWDGC